MLNGTYCAGSAGLCSNARPELGAVDVTVITVEHVNITSKSAVEMILGYATRASVTRI